MDERLRILRMVEEGKVSADEAAKLLEALGESKDGSGVRRRNRFLRVHVKEGEKTRINVNVPLELARLALRFVPKSALKLEGVPVEPEELARMLEEGVEGKIVDVDIDGDDGKTRVEIVVE